MSSYNYGPPPPPPPAAASASATSYPTQYGQYGQAARGGHSARGGRGGGADRNGYHQPAAAYGYGQQAPYTQHPPPPYPGPHAPQPAAYPPQQPQQQQWHHDQHAQHPQHAQQQHPQQPASHAPLAAQNYHPNYAPQLYQQQSQPYAGQPPYPPAPQPPYTQGYPSATPQPAPQTQQWGAHHPQPQGQQPFGSGSRGGRGGYNDRGGSKMMGPPIRLGFEGHQPGPQAPVSTPYPPPQPYTGHPAAAYPAQPYAPYPAPAPYMPTPPHYDAHSGGHNNRHQYRNLNSKPRGHFGGDKMRHRNPRGPNAQTPPNHHQKPDAASAGKKKKRKTNTLGLTPGDESESDDENEEERLEELIGAAAPNPTGPEIAEWIAARRANFPSKAKIEAKKAAAKAQNDRVSSIEKEEREVERLKRQLKKVESSIKRKREQQDEGDEMRDVDASSPSSDGKSDDEKPEVMSTRHEPSSVPPPTKKADPTKHCKYYSTGGTCGKRGKCRFVHDPAVREAALKEREEIGGRLTLEQRLALNDKDQEDMTIVRSLKYLHEKGEIQRWISKDKNTAASNAKQDEPPAAAPSSLPSAPARLEPGNGLPPIPPTSVVSQSSAKYPGWDLSGFGNTGVRSSDA